MTKDDLSCGLSRFCFHQLHSYGKAIVASTFLVCKKRLLESFTLSFREII